MATIDQVSPFAPDNFPDLPVVAGVSFATVAAGVKYQDRDDVMLALLIPGTSIAGVFTKSSTRSAPVLDCQAKLGGNSDGPAAILVNSGNANAFTGRRGDLSVEALCNALSTVTDVGPERIFTSSTGVIGEPLPHERIIGSLQALNDKLSSDAVSAAAKAIMTTDTFPKGASRRITVEGQSVTITGIAKGSGMIAPDMATMLGYVFTDGLIPQESLQSLVREINAITFNAITVDSDTSTSDTVLVAATGASGIDVSNVDAFKVALGDVMRDLAHQIVRDGEGATKFVEVSVTGAESDKDAKTHALAIANSPLVKTAIAGEDPNWGRIVMAVGKSGATADRDRLSIWFGDILVADNGWVSSAYREEDAATYMKNENLTIQVDLGLANGQATVWTCDLTHGYIEINADYRS